MKIQNSKVIKFRNFNTHCCHKKKSVEKIKLAVKFLKIISEENRLKILCFLQKQEKCVCEIWQFLNLHQNLISHHLKVLKSFGLIGSKKEGTRVFYFLKRKNIKKLTSLTSHFIK